MLLTEPEAALLEECGQGVPDSAHVTASAPEWDAALAAGRALPARSDHAAGAVRRSTGTQPRLTYRVSSRTQWRLAVIHARRKPRCFAGPYCYERAVVIERLAREVQGVPELGQAGRAGEEYFQE